MYHFAFYVPSTHAEKVKLAVFRAGAGQIGNYSHCSFEFDGIGQFLPLDNSQPAIGKRGVLESVQEKKIEMVCAEDKIEAVIQAMKVAHPYETPAYYVTKVINY